MVSLLGLEAYTPEQIAEARKLSPALNRYLEFKIPMEDPHQLRHEAWARCVLATYFQTATSEAVCTYWSQTADEILQGAWAECGLDKCEAVLFALGKQGAQELNLSSDIDLMLVAEGRDLMNVEKGLRRFRERLHLAGDYGFCFRLDFDLRPGGKMGPVITTPSQFQDYYWSQGETWERLALVRLRAVAGSKTLEHQIQDLARRFSFRKFLDFTLLDDLKALRSAVHQKGFARVENELHLKLEVGGIRDIELFVHSLLVMNGGKMVELQTRSTSAAITLLKAKNLIIPAEADFLLESYWFYRHAENLVQAFEDRQTHSLTLTQHAPGLPTMDEVKARMRAVDKIVSGLLGAVDLESVRLPASEDSQLIWLENLGFSEEAIRANWEPLISATALSHKNDRDERARQEFLYTFVTELSRNTSLDCNLGLSLLVDFVKATRAKATFFTMLLRTPRLIEDLARLFCLSPYLGSIIASRPELLDNFILQVDDAWAKDTETLLRQMTERKLLTELWSANQYLADRDLTSLFKRVTQTADSICAQLLVQLREEFPTSEIGIVTLGKWAGFEMGLRSDLDFIFVTPKSPNDDDLKVARRLISRLTDPSKGGMLYDLDLRLRPSGQSGPLLVEYDKLYSYWQNEAKPWERQAYLRARTLDPQLKLNKEHLVSRPITAAELGELKEIRTKLLRKPSETSIDIKYAPGGLLDIEFCAQTAVLTEQLKDAGCSTPEMLAVLSWKERAKLTKLYLQLREFEQMLQLSSTRKSTEARAGDAAFSKAAGLMGMDPENAWASLQNLLSQSRQILNKVDPTGLQI